MNKKMKIFVYIFLLISFLTIPTFFNFIYTKSTPKKAIDNEIEIIESKQNKSQAIPLEENKVGKYSEQEQTVPEEDIPIDNDEGEEYTEFIKKQQEEKIMNTINNGYYAEAVTIFERILETYNLTEGSQDFLEFYAEINSLVFLEEADIESSVNLIREIDNINVKITGLLHSDIDTITGYLNDGESLVILLEKGEAVEIMKKQELTDEDKSKLNFYHPERKTATMYLLKIKNDYINLLSYESNKGELVILGFYYNDENNIKENYSTLTSWIE